MTCEGGCPVYRSGSKNIKHIVFTCDRAKLVCQSLGVWENILEILNGSVILEEILRKGGNAPKIDGIGISELIDTCRWYVW